MRDLPQAIIHILRHFELAFSERVWEWAKVLLIGTILAPGKRTVTAALRVMGLSDETQFQNYHRVLNRATWSSRTLSRILLRLLLRAFVSADAPVVVGLDDHIERRRGAKMAPTSSTLAHSQTRSLKASSKCRRTCIIACGRSRMAHLFLAVECEPSVPCLSHFVYQMDKVELRAYPKTPSRL